MGDKPRVKAAFVSPKDGLEWDVNRSINIFEPSGGYNHSYWVVPSPGSVGEYDLALAALVNARRVELGEAGELLFVAVPPCYGRWFGESAEQCATICSVVGRCRELRALYDFERTVRSDGVVREWPRIRDAWRILDKVRREHDIEDPK